MAQLESIEQLQPLIDAMPFYVMLVDAKHHIHAVNIAITQAFGIAPEQLLGRYCPMAIHGINAPYAGCPLEQTVRTNQPTELDAQDETSEQWIRSSMCCR